jgi:hypothetical protein
MLIKNSVRTSKRTPHFTITKINWLTLFKFKPWGMRNACNMLVGKPKGRYHSEDLGVNGMILKLILEK